MNRKMYEIIYYDLDMLKSCLTLLESKAQKDFEYLQGFRYAYTLHDKDMARGKLKKAHYHLILDFKQCVRSERLYNLLKEVLPSDNEQCLNKATEKAYAYQIHANDLTKYQYPFDDIVCNFDYDDLYSLVEKNRKVTANRTNGYLVKAVLDIIDDNKHIGNIKDLIYYLISNGMYDIAGYVSKNTYFVRELFDNRKDKNVNKHVGGKYA